VPADDDFLKPEEPTIVTHGIPTPSQGMRIPDFDSGFALGHHRGLADFAHGLRLALLHVGVLPEEVEPIVMTVRKWVR
jgi:hypothetical protein